MYYTTEKELLTGNISIKGHMNEIEKQRQFGRRNHKCLAFASSVSKFLSIYLFYLMFCPVILNFVFIVCIDYVLPILYN